MRPESFLVDVGGGVVCCRITGNGPPALAIPAGNGPQPILPLLNRLSERFTVVLVDIPGYLRSDPLPMPEPSIADYADAMACLMERLGQPRYLVFGSHTGASIAGELALRHPSRCARVVLHEGTFLPEAARPAMIANYMPAYEPVWHGAHQVGLWQRFREQELFRPWLNKGNRIAGAGDDSTKIDEMFIVQAAAGPTYGDCYVAVFRHDLSPTVRALSVPFRITATNEPWLAGPRAAGFNAEHVSNDEGPALYGDWFAAAALPAMVGRPAASATATKRLVVANGHHLMVRRQGSGEPSLVIPQLPGPAVTAQPILDGLGDSVVPELSGNGDSFGPPSQPSVSRWADDAAAVMAATAMANASVVGIGTGAIVATELARRGLVDNLVLVNPPLAAPALREELRRRYAADIAPHWDGTHLVRLWQALRNEALFWPWYDQRPEATRRIVPDLDVATLEARSVGILKHAASYAAACEALFGYDLVANIVGFRRPTRIVTIRRDLFAELSADAASLFGGAPHVRIDPPVEDASLVFKKVL